MNTLDRRSDAYSNDQSEFVVRYRIPHIWQLSLLFVVCFSVLYGVAIYAHYLGGNIAVGFAIFAVIGPLCWFTIYFAQRNRDMLLAAEFQNALFSAAARLRSKFCMIVKQDGTIVYNDRNFQEVFPETANRSVLAVDKIFSSRYIAPGEAEKLFKALETNTPGTVYIDLKEQEGKMQRVVISIDPLPRPRGFFILRGRDYVVKQYERTNAQVLPAASVHPAINSTVTHMINALPYGLYATDADGHIQFINYRLEGWLGYDQNEIISKQLALHDIIPSINTPLVENLLLKDCKGVLKFQSKQNHTVSMHIQQEITKDANGGVLGSAAILQPAMREEVEAKDTTPAPIATAPRKNTLSF